MGLACEKEHKEKGDCPSHKQRNHDPWGYREDASIVRDKDTAEEHEEAKLCRAELENLDQLNTPFNLQAWNQLWSSDWSGRYLTCLASMS